MSSGVTGVILGYYFNRSRLKRAQDAESRASAKLNEISETVLENESKLLEMELKYASLIEELAASEADS